MSAPESTHGTPDPASALPPRSGYRRRSVRALGRAADAALDLNQALRRGGMLIDGLAEEVPRRQVAVFGVYGPRGARPMAAMVAELRRSRHAVEFALGALGGTGRLLERETSVTQMEGGKLTNLNRLAAGSSARGAEWVLLLDDDIVLPGRFLDRMVGLAEHFDLHLAQPALTQTSHTAWPIVRRRPGILRETRFVEMGPVVLMRREAFAALTPFPEEGMGWGVCLHWAAVAKREGWRLGIADAVPVGHDSRPPAESYDRAEALAAARELLRSREHIGWREAGEVLARHRAPR